MRSEVTIAPLPPSGPSGKLVTITLLDRDLMDLKLDNFDRALLDECGRVDASAADKLLALEMLFRRAQQQLSR